MKIIVAHLVVVLLGFKTYAQKDSTRASYFGLDVINSIPTYVLPNWYYIRKTIIIEPYYRFDIKRPDASVVIGAGFAKGSTHQYNEFDPSQNFRGAYFRASYEFKHRPRFISVGYGPIISFAGYSGNFVFKGPTFGDYEGSFREKHNVAIGWEGYVAYNLKLSRDLSLRFLLRNQWDGEPKRPFMCSITQASATHLRFSTTGFFIQEVFQFNFITKYLGMLAILADNQSFLSFREYLWPIEYHLNRPVRSDIVIIL